MPDPIVDPIVEQIRKQMLQLIMPSYRQRFEQVPITRVPPNPMFLGQYVPTNFYPGDPGNRIEITSGQLPGNALETTYHETAHAFSVPQWGLKWNWEFPQNNPGFNFTMNPRPVYGPPLEDQRRFQSQSPGIFWDDPAAYQGAGWQPFAQAVWDPPARPFKTMPSPGFTNPMEAYAEIARVTEPQNMPQQLTPYYPWQQPAPIQPEPTPYVPPSATPWNYVMPPEQYAQWRQGEY
jgi:hypothetical protein